MPDLAALSPLAGRKLPPLHDVAAHARLTDAAGGLAHGAAMRDLTLTVPQADLAGEVALAYGGRPSVRATLASRGIDADALMQAVNASPASDAAPPAAASAPPAPAPAPPAPPPAPAPARPKRVFSDRALPFPMLRLADADLRLSVGDLRAGGTDYRDIALHLVLADGKLALDPAVVHLPGGRLDGRATVDASQQQPPVALTLKAPGLPLAQLLAVLRLPTYMTGNLEIDADLRGAGDTPHALASTASGHLGLALVDGAIDNRLVSSTVGQALQHARLPDITAHPGRTSVRCFALRLNAQHGTADVRALLLDTNLADVQGDGSMNLADETLSLRLRPLVRLGGTGVVLPLLVTGSLLAPKVAVDAAAGAAEAAGMAAAAGRAAQAGRSPQLGLIIGALGANGLLQGGDKDNCPAALAAARGGAPGKPPVAAPAAPAAPKLPRAPKPPNPADLLRQFLR